MRKILLVLILPLIFTTLAFAHSGGTDSCGGHNDRKLGGYHVHNYSKYCRCYPAECVKRSTQKKDATEKPVIDEKKRVKA